MGDIEYGGSPPSAWPSWAFDFHRATVHIVYVGRGDGEGGSDDPLDTTRTDGYIDGVGHSGRASGGCGATSMAVGCLTIEGIMCMP